MSNPINVLLVEDDEVDVMSVKRAFMQNNITNPLYVVENGEEALDFLLQDGEFANPDLAPRPSLILLDLNLPRMNGLELLEIVKSNAELCEIPVVVLTSSTMESDIKYSFRNGVAGYVVKPVTFEKFVQAVAILDMYWTLSKLP